MSCALLCVWDIISEIPQECGCWPDAASNPGVPYQFTPFNLCANYAPQEYAFYVVGLAHCSKDKQGHICTIFSSQNGFHLKQYIMHYENIIWHKYGNSIWLTLISTYTLIHKRIHHGNAEFDLADDGPNLPLDLFTPYTVCVLFNVYMYNVSNCTYHAVQ